MVIAFSLLSFNEPGHNSDFLLEIFRRNTIAHPEDQFILIAPEQYKSIFFPENVTLIAAEYNTKRPMKWAVWHNLKIRKIVKKYKADILVTEKIGSMLTKVPQVLVLPDCSFIHQPSLIDKRKRAFLKKLSHRFFKKSTAIIVSSRFDKEAILKHNLADGSKIEVIYEGVNSNFKPIGFVERENTSQQFAGGNEYFIYSGIISPQQNLKNLLKGFSAFKKRQRSGMQLIIAGPAGKHFDQFKQSLETYKFKKEINLQNGLSEAELVKLTAASYAMVDASGYDTTAQSLLSAMQCGVAVLASANSAAIEICGEAALYFDAVDHKNIAEKMMDIFKDEQLRKELIEKGHVQVQKYNWEKSAELLWRCIEATGMQ